MLVQVWLGLVKLDVVEGSCFELFLAEQELVGLRANGTSAQVVDLVCVAAEVSVQL